MDRRALAELSQVTEDTRLVIEQDSTEKIEGSSPADLFHLYETIVEARPGTRDAEIFEKIREWTFSDFGATAYEFAGITKAELDAWQTRHRINLSAGQIRPDPIDLQRGYAWGHIRMSNNANRFHSDRPPPSAQEIKLTWSPSLK